MKHPSHYDTDEKTSARMSHVKLKGGAEERILAQLLWHQGFRYRLNDKSLPGSPDIAILRFHVAVFVDGEFWHGYDWKNKKLKLKRNRDYWIQKIEENIERDKRNNDDLMKLGWYVVRFWANDVKKDPDKCIASIISAIDMLR